MCQSSAPTHGSAIDKIDWYEAASSCCCHWWYWARYDVLIRINDSFKMEPAIHHLLLADVAIQDGRIARIGKLGAVNAKRVMESEGLVVSPGFIDNHSDYTHHH